MPKQPAGVGLAEARATAIAEKMGYKLVDVELVKESTGRFLRFFVDRDGGISLSDCEAFHRAVQKLVEDIDYDYMEVSSPGVDRPLKKPRDFEEAAGERVEVRLYRPLNGVRVFTGTLIGLEGDQVVIEGADGARLAFERKLVALTKKLFEFDERMLEESGEQADDCLIEEELL